MSKHLSVPRDPISAYSHLIGILLSLLGTIFIAIEYFIIPDITTTSIISAIVFGFSLIALYSASTIYHWSHASSETIKILRKLDHSMIYVLIAGSYTPILLGYLPTSKSTVFVFVMWIVALIGIIIKLCWFNAPRWLSTTLYILMGWAILVDPTAITSMESGALTLLILGGVSYTIGGVIYAIKKPNLSPKYGFHELFHIFVLIGSLFHYFVVVLYIL